jgi:hypothetical protein
MEQGSVMTPPPFNFAKMGPAIKGDEIALCTRPDQDCATQIFLTKGKYPDFFDDAPE